ncbi:hypothetical protein L9F63_013971, partial [Diploptera punctata]
KLNIFIILYFLSQFEKRKTPRHLCSLLMINGIGISYYNCDYVEFPFTLNMKERI